MTEAISPSETLALETHLEKTIEEPTVAQKLFLALKANGLYKYEKFLGNGAFGSVVQLDSPDKKIALKLTRFNPENLLSKPHLAGEPLSLTFPRHKHLGRSYAILTYDGQNVHLLKTFNPKLHSKHIYLGNLSRAVEGGSLHDLLKKRKCTTQELKTYGKQMAEAIHALHSINLVHKDIHVENILIKKNQKIRLIDFQHARPQNSKDLQKDWKKFAYLLMEMASPQELKNPHFFDLIFSQKHGILQGQRPYSASQILSHPFFR